VGGCWLDVSTTPLQDKLTANNGTTSNVKQVRLNIPVSVLETVLV